LDGNARVLLGGRRPRAMRMNQMTLRQTPYVLPEQTWLSSIAGLGKFADSDWYRLDVQPGNLRVQIACTFKHAEGDIDIFLYDSSGSEPWLTQSESATDNESIDFIVPAAGVYYLEFWAWEAVGNNYDLWWKGLPAFEDK